MSEPCADEYHATLTFGVGATCPQCGIAWTSAAAIEVAQRLNPGFYTLGTGPLSPATETAINAALLPKEPDL